MATKISGCGTLSSGKYDEIIASGAIKLEGDISCASLCASGSLKADKLSCDGALKIAGAASFSGDVFAKSIGISGAFKTSGCISCGELTARGAVKALGNISADEKLDVHGAIKSEEEIASKEICVIFDSDSELTKVRGEKIEIKPQRRFWLFKRKCYVLSSVEGGEISLEYVTSPKVSGARVKIGDGCRIDLLEYSESYEISPKAKVSKINLI